MSRILFAWEMGGNFGHIARDLPLALACREAGHEVLFAVTDLTVCTAIAKEYGFAFVQTPSPKSKQAVLSNATAINYADMLLQNGWTDVSVLEASVLGWHALFGLFRPDLLVYDYAPRALLAARLAAVPVVLLGNGFETPPNTTPLPSFRPWEKISGDALLAPEHHLVENINVLLTRAGHAKIDRLWDLFASHPLVIAYFEEFDHFGPREGAHYVGPASRLAATKKIELGENRQHVLVYLRSSIPKIENLFDALQQVDAVILCVVPDLPADWPAKYGRLRFFQEPLDLQHLLPNTSLVITHGSGTFADAVTAGVPVLMVPAVIEQFLAGVRLERQGFGTVLRKRDSVEGCLAAIQELLDRPRYRQAAQQLAKRYAAFRPEHSVQRQLSVVQKMLLSAEAGSGS